MALGVAGAVGGMITINNNDNLYSINCSNKFSVLGKIANGVDRSV